MKSQIRLDSGTISAVRNDNGILTASVKLSRTGVFPYVYSDGKVVREAKLPEELFKQSVIDSANGAVITDKHPAVKNDSDTGLVNNSNYSELAKGNVFNVRQDGSFLVGMEKIYDADLRSRIESGEQVQVSIGFRADIDWTPGEYNGEKYDAVQRNIDVNHIAHVDLGRAGEECRTYLDSVNTKNYAISQELNMAIIDHTKQPEKTLTLRVDGKDIQVSKQTMDLVSTLKKSGLTVKLDADPAPAPMAETGTVTPTDTEAPAGTPAAPAPDMAMIQEKLKMADNILNTIQTKYNIGLEELMSLLEAKDEMIKVFQSKIPAQVEAAVQDDRITVRRANAVLPELKTDSLSTRQIKEAVIKKVLPNFKAGKFDSLSDTEIEIGFESAMTLSQVTAQTVSAVKTDSPEASTRLDEMQKKLEEAKQNYYKRGVK